LNKIIPVTDGFYLRKTELTYDSQTREVLFIQWICT